MKDKVALITGGTGGIGKAIAINLAKEGVIVCIQYNKNKTEGEKLKQHYANIHLFQQDFLAKEMHLVNDVIAKFHRIDYLINCAGIMGDNSILEMDADDFDRVFAVNTRTPYLLSAAAFKAMQKNNFGRIINISSITIKFGFGRNQTIQYAGSKAALETLTTGLSRMGAKHNILVNSIRPGVINTDIQKDRPNLKNRIEMIPVKRIGEPDEIAQMVNFLLSEKGSFITGETITISGGE